MPLRPATAMSSNPINFINAHSLHQNPLLTMCIDKVKWFTAHSRWQAEMAFIHSQFKLKREKPRVPTLSHKMCPRKQTTKKNCRSWHHFSQEKPPHTLVPVTASTHCGKYCISHYFRVQLFSRFWTRCGNSRVVNFAIFLMLSLL